jgi:2-polyprenyl-3-methyl-5-hydroxy-6-metoxy-1,4-benzoquinol methylase
LTHLFCRVCAAEAAEPRFSRKSEFTLTSAHVFTSIQTIDVCQCPHFSHVQSQLNDNQSRYHDSDHNLHLGGADTDDLYTVQGGKTIYRAEHQLDVLRAAYDFSITKRVLDFGCGEAANLSALAKSCRSVTPMVFDVNSAYVPFWDAFVEPHNQAVYDIPEYRKGTCDLIVSFFALEHVADPRYFEGRYLATTANRWAGSPAGAEHV